MREKSSINDVRIDAMNGIQNVMGRSERVVPALTMSIGSTNIHPVALLTVDPPRT